MKLQSEKEGFIQLRARGLSFDKISVEIGVSKPTLLKWDQEFAKEIANLRYLEADSLLTQYKLAKRHRIECLGALLRKALDAVEQRDFSDMPTKDLLAAVYSLEAKLSAELASISFRAGDLESPFDTCNDSMFKERTLPLSY